MHQNRITPYLEASFAVIVWGASFTATKVALPETTPVMVVWIRFAMGVVVLGAAVFARREYAWPPRNEILYFALLGFIGITFHQWLQSNGLVTAQAATSAWIVAVTPIFILLLGRVFLREHVGWFRASGILVAAVGVLLVVSRGDLNALTAGRLGAPGDILMLISSPNWAIFSVLSRRGLRTHPAARMMFFVMTLGWLFTSAQLFSGTGLSELTHLSGTAWVSLIFLGIFASGLAYIAWYDALQSLPAAQVGAFLYIEPLAAVVVALVVLGEAVTFVSLLGGALILAGVYQVNRQGKTTAVTDHTDRKSVESA